MAEKEEEYEEGVDENYDPEAEVGGNWAVQVNLPEVPLVTGEENDDLVAKLRAKLYRYVDKQWKERGIGDLKFMRNKATNKVRIVMRQEKTHKIVANHFLLQEASLCKLIQLKTSDRAWIWDCYDISDDASKFERLCAKFVTKEDFEKFKTEFEKACTENQAIRQKQKELEKETEKKPEGEEKKVDA